MGKLAWVTGWQPYFDGLRALPDIDRRNVQAFVSEYQYVCWLLSNGDTFRAGSAWHKASELAGKIHNTEWHVRASNLCSEAWRYSVVGPSAYPCALPVQVKS